MEDEINFISDLNQEFDQQRKFRHRKKILNFNNKYSMF